MNLFQLLFPEVTRTVPARRWISISLRTLHLIGVAGIGGGFLYSAPQAAWLPFLRLTVISGLVLFSLEIYTHGIYLVQLRGVAVIIKVILTLALLFWGVYGAVILIAIIVLSGVFSHAPRYVRYFSIFHGRRVESPK
jgi:hypothetical protein